LIDGIGTTEMLHIFISAEEATVKPGATGKSMY
jgi:2-aminobenzoate-CoA ligase